MLALLVIPAVISAATFAGGEEYSLGKNKNIDGNLYAGGAVVSIAGSITGDLITGGGNVIITGNISDDILARLMTFNNVLITSHQGFFTREALQNIAETTLFNIKQYNEGKELKNEICYKCDENECRKEKTGRCF